VAAATKFRSRAGRARGPELCSPPAARPSLSRGATMAADLRTTQQQSAGRKAGSPPLRSPVEPADHEHTTFAELVLVHHLRQTELYRAARSGAPADDLALDGPADKLY